jgi:hypothetical protein
MGKITDVDGWALQIVCVCKPKSALNSALTVDAAKQQLTASGRDAVCDIIPALA